VDIKELSMATKDYYLNTIEQQVPLDFSEDGLMYLLHFPSGKKTLNQQELEWFCAKKFGNEYRFVEDALFHGEIVDGISLDILT